MNYKVWQYNKVVKEFPTKLQALIYCLIGNFLNKIKKGKRKMAAVIFILGALAILVWANK